MKELSSRDGQDSAAAVRTTDASPGHPLSSLREPIPTSENLTKESNHVANGNSPSPYPEEDADDLPASYSNLDELAPISPIQSISTHLHLEDTRIRRPEPPRHVRLAPQVYTHAYLVIFAFLGTLARLGIRALTDYPGAPIIFGSIWENFSGSVVMGFLVEDRNLFREHDALVFRTNSAPVTRTEDDAAAKKAHVALKKTIPLYIGLTTGFCGSFTSFSSLISDSMLALLNELAAPGTGGTLIPRNGFYSFLSVLAVLICSTGLSLSGFILGTHLALGLSPILPSLPGPRLTLSLDRVATPLAALMYIAVILLAALNPVHSWPRDVLFALVFAPVGCLLRFHLSSLLNARVASFPMGTFAANVFATAMIGVSWCLTRVPVSGGAIACFVLKGGIEDGFCGCLSTVSTWVAELVTLRRRHAYFYGVVSVLVALATLVLSMGILKWTKGLREPMC